MKKIFLILVMAISLFGANAADAAFALGYEEVYKTALAKAKKEDKILMMVIVKEPCPYCDALVERTLDTPETKAKLKDFVPLIIDVHDSFPKDMKPPFTPMTNFINPTNNDVIWEVPGYSKKADFLEAMDEAKNMKLQSKKK